MSVTEPNNEVNCVEFKSVVKRFGSVEVLKHVSFGCQAGHTTAIVGASGSGKTTLLQLVNGVLQHDCGDVLVFGETVPKDNVEQFRRGIGYVVQSGGLFPHMTAFENVVLVAKLQGFDEPTIMQRYSKVLGEVGLPEEVSNRLPRELSGGQQQRLGICRALMLQPKLLLLDEPFSAVDPITRADIYAQFEHIKAVESVSALLVTHDLREAKRLAEDLVILYAGEVQQFGSTTEVLENPSNEYVANLVRSQLQ